MLDAKQAVAPVIWQLTYKMTYDAPKDLWSYFLNNILDYCEWFPYKFNPYVEINRYSGVCWIPKGKKSIVADVMKNSPAERLGLLPGDELLKIDGRNFLERHNTQG